MYVFWIFFIFQAPSLIIYIKIVHFTLTQINCLSDLIVHDRTHRFHNIAYQRLSHIKAFMKYTIISIKAIHLQHSIYNIKKHSVSNIQCNINVIIFDSRFSSIPLCIIKHPWEIYSAAFPSIPMISRYSRFSSNCI